LLDRIYSLFGSHAETTIGYRFAAVHGRHDQLQVLFTRFACEERVERGCPVQRFNCVGTGDEEIQDGGETVALAGARFACVEDQRAATV
jgi:hypothetical protein